MPRLEERAPADAEPEQVYSRPDLRLPALGAAAWVGALLGAYAAHGPRAGATAVVVGLAGCLAVVLAGVVLVRVPHARATVLAGAAVLVAVGVGAGLRSEQTGEGPLADLARERAVVSVVGSVASDPREVRSPYGSQVVVDLVVREVTGRGATHRLRTRVVVLAPAEWLGTPLGSTVRTSGRLAPADDAGVAGLLQARAGPTVVERPDAWWRGAATVRAAIRVSVEHRPAEQAALVPALVDGDDSAITPDLADDFETTGLTHLLAVSGTNLTLVVGFLLAIARWCRVRGRGLAVVGALGIVGFVLLARTEPSVVRAAAMGAVGLVAMGVNGRHRALRGLGAAVLALLLLDPGLARSVGFALSVLATLGILVLGPPWRDALARWLPRWLAEAVAVPAAAQLAVTPLVAAISGRVSLVAVLANLLVEPLVGPATVLGLAGGLVALVSVPLGQLVGTLAGWAVAWIVLVAREGAAFPVADVGWGSGPVAIAALTAVVGVVAVGGPHLLARRAVGVAVAVVMVLVVVRPWPAVLRPPGAWPPDDWLVVGCDVGQGDAFVLRSGPASAVVVDTGPEPRAVDACLDRLGVTQVPLVVLSHFHADHVDGLAGVLEGRAIGEVLVSPTADGSVPTTVREAAAGVSVVGAAYGETRQVGDVRLQVVWPTGPAPPPIGEAEGGAGGEESAANDTSVVLLAEVGGLRVLLTGDIEPPAQASLARDLVGLEIDVLKVPHHGSRYQDADWLSSLGADVALISAGEDNDYGHPAASTVDLLGRAGAEVVSTHRDGGLAVVAGDDGPVVETAE